MGNEPSAQESLVVATFGPTTAWVGKTITFHDGQFVLEDHGPIAAADVLAYHQQGHLIWAYDGLHEWVCQVASMPAGQASSATPAAAAEHDDQILVFDTETSDLPRDWHRPASDLDNWPHLLQIAWIVCDLEFRPRRSYCTLIRPDGWEVAPGAARVNGISTKKALKHGVPVATVLPSFDAELQACGLVAAHNLEFDRNVMTAEFLRARLPHHFEDIEGFCTMRGTTAFCRLTPKRYGEYKWPTLAELHEICTGKPHRGAHDAMGDAEAVCRCLAQLHRTGHLSVDVVSRSS
jgi:DNA polymerase-3 subunit epsilon